MFRVDRANRRVFITIDSNSYMSPTIPDELLSQSDAQIIRWAISCIKGIYG